MILFVTLYVAGYILCVWYLYKVELSKAESWVFNKYIDWFVVVVVSSFWPVFAFFYILSAPFRK